MFTEADHRYMARALALARLGLTTTDPNPRVGSVVVKEDVIVGEGAHIRAGEPHAEVHALRTAGAQARGASVYVTLEPCDHEGRTPPCTEALVMAGVKRVVAAMTDPNPQVAGRGLRRLREAGVEVACGLCEPQAQALNPGFSQRMRQGRPWVRVKSAISLDGRTALSNGHSQWITGEAARRDVQFWRARSSAMLTGIGTCLADDPRLDVRLSPQDLNIEGPVRQPVRVVLDSQLRLNPKAQILREPGRCLVFTRTAQTYDHSRVTAFEDTGAEVIPVAGNSQGLALTAVMHALAVREVNEVQVEAGPTLVGALAQAGLIDEWIVYLAPRLLGDQARPLAYLPDISRMTQALELTLVETRPVGGDLRLSFRPDQGT